jgi:cell wall-associated NlpC family hydrolase
MPLLLLLFLCLIGGCSQHSPPKQVAPDITADMAPDPDPEPPTTTTAPVEIRRGIPMSRTTNPVVRQRRFLESMLRPLEPSLHGDPSRLDLYIDCFKQHCITDRRLFAFNVCAQSTGNGQITLTGDAEYPEHRDGLLRMLHFLGFQDIDDQIQLLPSTELKDQPYALVTASHTFIYDKTTEPREKMSQAIYAEPLILLKQTPDGYYLCHAIDGYVGYVSVADVHRVSAKEFHAYHAASQAYLLKDFKFNSVTIPAGARLHVASVAPQKITVQSPAGEKFTIPTGQFEIGDPRPTHLINIIIDTAMQLRETKYVWGGKTSDGIDCSGLIQLAFKTHGINLPRDADEQVLVGAMVATRSDRTDLRRGDLLFFLSRRGTINHVALYLGNNTFLQASGEKVKISSFDPNAPNYDKGHDQEFCFAKRLLE